MSPNRSIVGNDHFRDELERLYRAKFYDYLRVAEAITGDKEAAIEGVQEGFARVLQYRRKYRGESSLTTWVWRCVINAAKTSRPERRHELEYEMPPTAMAHGADHYDTVASITRDLVASLPERQRLVLFLRYYADMDYRTIAKLVHLDVGTIGATLNQARAALRKRLEEV